jgi:Mrp family chromosome partitioning ATPase/uncharacterized protein involved in exopolysaccharide biosynthesis
MRTDLYPGETPGIEHYLFALRRRWPVLIVCVALGALLGTLFVDRRPHTFGASTKVLVGASAADQSKTPDLKTEADVVTSTAVARAALAQIGGTNVDEALNSVSVVFPSQSSVLDIVAKAPDPFRARDLSTAFANAYIAQREAATRRMHDVSSAALVSERDGLWAQSDADDVARTRLVAALAVLEPTAANAAEQVRLRESLADLDSQRTLRTQRLTQITSELGDLDRQAANVPVAAQVLRAATVPTKALGTPNSMILLAFVMGGVLAGVIACFVLWRRDGSAAGAQRVEDAIGAPVLGEVPFSRPQLVSSMSTAGQGSTAGAGPPMAAATYEAYLRACRFLSRSLAERGQRAVVVSSGDAAREKSLVATNLAMTFARLGNNTVLVCADLLGAGPERLLDPVPGPGMSEVLAEGAALDLQSHRAIANLYVLGAGERPGDARDLLGTDAMRTLLDQLADKFDIVIVDSSPVFVTADGVTLGAMVGAAVLVAGHKRRALRLGGRAREELERGGCVVLGVVVDQA